MTVPLGETYLELIAVVDAAAAEGSAFGRWVGSASSSGGLHPLGWSVRTDDLDGVAERLSLKVLDGSRAMPDGLILRWRMAGLDEAAAAPALPFFIEWATGTPHPGRASAADRRPRTRISELRLRAEATRLAAWLGRHDLPLEVRPGKSAVTSVVLTGDVGDVVLGGDR